MLTNNMNKFQKQIKKFSDERIGGHDGKYKK